ncbi:MAG: LLM class F420-dependent oxidoreductase [SAR202 cluster bacterium Io17-Chloro-G9]|nr:MAG: LLM class F420-dependent oxidoreductase [SAR202 cluster bacterium Io17-Chloro-G9]
MRVIYHLNTSDVRNIPGEARWAEDMGYDGLSVEETAHDPFSALMLAATTTSRVTLETRVAIAFPRSPMVVAQSARDLQDFSGGRFRLGLGTQVKGHIERRFSVPWISPGPRIREYVQALHAIWDNWQDGKRLDFQGRFYTFNLMTPFFSPGAGVHPKPPVSISAVNPYNCRVAGQVCDGLALHPLISPRYITEAITSNIETGAHREGRDPTDVKLSSSGFIITGPNAKTIDARKEATKQRIAFYASTRTYFPVLELHDYQELGQRLHALSLQGQWAEMTRLVSDEMLETFAIIGGYDDIALRIKEQLGALVDEVGFNMEVSTPEDEKALRNIIDELKG